MSEETKLPLPKDPKHQRFADLWMGGMKAPDAYRAAKLKVGTASSVRTMASRLLKKVDVLRYVEAVQQAAAQSSVLSVEEKRVKFARIFRANILKIDPRNPDDPNGDLIKKVKIKEVTDVVGNVTKTVEFEIHDALGAARDDNKLSGDDPEANALASMAAALARIGNVGGALPVDRM